MANGDIQEIKKLILSMQNEMEKRFDALETRQDEMYQILRGIEEFRPISETRFDNLEHDVAQLKNHTHKTDRPEEIAQEG